MVVFDRWVDSFYQVAGIAPESDHRPGEAVLIAEYTDAGRAQYEKHSCDGFQPEPPGREHAQKVTAGKNQDMAGDRAETIHDAIGSICNRARRFSLRNTVPE